METETHGHGYSKSFSLFATNTGATLTDITSPGGLIQMLIKANGAVGIATECPEHSEWRVMAVDFTENTDGMIGVESCDTLDEAIEFVARREVEIWSCH